VAGLTDLVPAHLPRPHFPSGRAQFAVAVVRKMQFMTIYISQGSAATRFRCDGIFKDSFIAFFQSVC